MFRTLPLFLILFASPALAAGWPGGKRTVSTSVVEQFFALSHSLMGDGSAIGEVSVTAGISSTGGIPIASGYVPASATASRGTLGGNDVTRTLPIVGDLAGVSDILALELNQAGGATTALCSLTWEALQ